MLIMRFTRSAILNSCLIANEKQNVNTLGADLVTGVQRPPSLTVTEHREASVSLEGNVAEHLLSICRECDES